MSTISRNEDNWNESNHLTSGFWQRKTAGNFNDFVHLILGFFILQETGNHQRGYEDNHAPVKNTVGIDVAFPHGGKKLYAAGYYKW